MVVQVLEQLPVLIQALTQPGKLVIVQALIRLEVRGAIHLAHAGHRTGV